MLTMFLLTFVLVGAAVLAMATGAIVSGRCLRASCGGTEVSGSNRRPLKCEDCPLRTASPKSR